MRGSLRASVLVVVALAAAAGATAPAAGPAGAAAVQAGSVGIRLLDVPVDAANDPRAKQYIVDNLVPGTTIERRVEISNTTTAPLRVRVYPDAATITGGAFIGGAGHERNDLTTWTSLSAASLVIPAHAVTRDTVTIAIPEDAAPGERYGVIWAEVSDSSGGSIAQVNRAGIRIYLSVGGGNPPPTSFTVSSLTATRNAKGNPVVLAQVHNTGGRAIDVTGSLSMVKVSGAVAVGPYPVELGTTLAPGQSEPVKVIVTDELVNGPWKATIALQSGLVQETAHAQITFPTNPGATRAVPAQGGGAPWIVALCTGGAAVLLVAIILLVLAARRRSRIARSHTAR